MKRFYIRFSMADKDGHPLWNKIEAKGYILCEDGFFIFKDSKGMNIAYVNANHVLFIVEEEGK